MVHWYNRTSLKLRIWFLRQLWRARLLRFILAVVVDRVPKQIAASDPRLAQALTEVKASLDARFATGAARGQGFAQSITWGLAGVGVVILTAIVTTHSTGRAIVIAATCFSLSVPFLVVIGSAYVLIGDPLCVQPTKRQILFLTVLLLAVHIIFFTGLAAFLWSYDFRIAIVFIIACYLAWRYYLYFSVKHLSAQSNKADQNDSGAASR